ncbi:MAG: HAMP domain-containing histidine kinase [Lachnospiraceae bacterium]|nr:HAMP domain-containing histidine kinase [Lachnospiraceae bacterium]
MLKKLRIEFICINMMIVTGMLGIILGLFFYFARGNLAEQSVRALQTIGREPFYEARPEIPLQNAQFPIFSLYIGENGKLTAMGGGNYDLSDEAFLQSLFHAVTNSREQTGIIREYRLRFCRIVTPKEEYFVFGDISSEMKTLRNLIKDCILIGAGGFLSFLFISVLFSYWAVRPVDRAWRQQRQFVADASHELKTPLTVILTNAELLQESDGSEPANGKCAENILIMARQMRGLVEGLLELARVDNGTVKMSMSQVDFSSLVADTILPFEPLYFERRLELCSHIEEEIWIKGSDAYLRQAVEILLDNALKYAAPDTGVEIVLKKQGRHCVFSVANRGEAIAEEELKHIFERFYRVDKARSRDGSYGLGLAIAESIVGEHGGRVWAESSGGINVFFMQFPLQIQRW